MSYLGSQKKLTLIVYHIYIWSCFVKKTERCKPGVIQTNLPVLNKNTSIYSEKSCNSKVIVVNPQNNISRKSNERIQMTMKCGI